MLATDSTAGSVAVSGSEVDAGVAAALTTPVDCWFTDDELADPERFVGALPAEFSALCESPCCASRVAPSGATSDDTGCSVSDAMAGSSVSDATAGCSVSDATAGCSTGDAVVDCSSGGAAATAEGTPGGVGIASADAVVSLLDEVEPVCAPPELCTTPARGSPVEASRGKEVELVCESVELCTASDVEPDEEPAADADEVVDEVASADEALAADSDDELDVDDESDDESDDEAEELVSSGAANATAGVFATAAPTPSRSARTPARTMCCASTGKAARG
jgi:hypothetical protein